MRSSSFPLASLIPWFVVSLLAFGCNFQQSASPSPTVVATGGMGGGSPIIVTGSVDGPGAGARDGGAPAVCPAQRPAGKICLAGSCQPDPCMAGLGDDLRGRAPLPREVRPDRRPMRGRELSSGTDLRRRRLRRRLLRATLQRRDLPGRADLQSGKRQVRRDQRVRCGLRRGDGLQHHLPATEPVRRDPLRRQPDLRGRKMRRERVRRRDLSGRQHLQQRSLRRHLSVQRELRHRRPLRPGDLRLHAELPVQRQPRRHVRRLRQDLRVRDGDDALHGRLLHAQLPGQRKPRRHVRRLRQDLRLPHRRGRLSRRLLHAQLPGQRKPRRHSDGCGKTCGCPTGEVGYQSARCMPHCPSDGSRGGMSNGCGGTCSCPSGTSLYNGSCCAPNCPSDGSRGGMPEWLRQDLRLRHRRGGLRETLLQAEVSHGRNLRRQ